MLRFSRLRIAGFKSFVDPVDLIVEPGLTGIVGPNGCGKSNLVEALRWVMGEASARQMRGAEMDDVIFAGAAGRPARQLAEVVLDLDNSDGHAPPPWHTLDVITVGRKIDRGRGSSYRVNGREVRARDVQLLFADAATGARSAGLVSQGQIGTIINQKPRDRRIILEEASGITGLHARRHEAELRLRAAAGNLERVEDILSALDAQLRHLQKQARQAKRYRNVSEGIREAEVLVYALAWKQAEAAVAESEAERSRASSSVADRASVAAGANTVRMECAARLPALREAETTAVADMQAARAQLAALEAEEQRQADDRAAAAARLAQASADLEREQGRRVEAENTLSDLANERERLLGRRDGDVRTHEAAQRTLTEIAGELEALEARVTEQTRVLATSVASRNARSQRLDDLAKRRDRLSARQRELEAQLESLARERAQIGDPEVQSEAAVRALRAFEDAQGKALEAETASQKATETASSMREDRIAADAAANRWRAEAEALRSLLEAEIQSDTPPIVDSVDAPSDLVGALSAALGDDLLAPETLDAPAAWRTLEHIPDAPALPDGIPPLAERISAPAALSRRLSQTGLVSDSETGNRLQPALRTGQRLVTAAGDLWRWDGFTTTSAASGPAARLRQRNRLREINDLCTGAETTAADAASREAEASAKAGDAAQALAAARDALKVERRAADEAAQADAKTQRAIAQFDARRSAAEAALAPIADELAEISRTCRELKAEEDAQPDLARDEEQLAQLRNRVAAQRTEEQARRAALDAIARDMSARAGRLRRIDEETRTWGGRRDSAAGHATALAERKTAAEADVDRLAAMPSEIAARRSAAIEALSGAEHQRRTAGDAVAAADSEAAEADRRARAADAALAAAREELVRVEGTSERAAATLADIESRITDALDASPEQVVALANAALPSDDQMPDLPSVERKLEKLRRERDAIGPVNLCAEQEANDLTEQRSALEREKCDLEDAIAKLRRGVAELTREGRKRLLASFDTVNSSFQELFTRLFGGGEAHLALTESDDPLEAGLEIMARPPGKKMQTLSLLSGGEQALAALALVFAVFRSNPSPICVLDEVDAPLDDANVDRFCSLLDEMAAAGETRFLVITHHRMTMARMHRLFGVTMAERGVSQLVTVDLLGAEELRKTA